MNITKQIRALKKHLKDQWLAMWILMTDPLCYTQSRLGQITVLCVCIAQEQIFTTSTSNDGDRDSHWNIGHQLHIDICDCPRRPLYTIAMKASIIYKTCYVSISVKFKKSWHKEPQIIFKVFEAMDKTFVQWQNNNLRCCSVIKKDQLALDKMQKWIWNTKTKHDYVRLLNTEEYKTLFCLPFI